MADVLERKKLLELDEKRPIQGYAYITSVSILPTKNGGQYITGNLQAKGQVPYKVWDRGTPDCAFSEMAKNVDDYNDSAVLLSGEIDKYGGSTSIIINSIKIVDHEQLGLTKSDFFEEVYDAEMYYANLLNVLKKYCSEKAVEVFNLVVNPVKSRFMEEFAAVSHHDNCKSGLLAHTTKVVRAATLLKMYPDICKRIGLDNIFISCALHDIGKIFEYSNGTMSNAGQKVSHHVFGVSMISDKRTEIVNLMGEEFYLNLLSVISQHHGEYGERPRTALAYVVHLIDCLEANLTTLNNSLADVKPNTVNTVVVNNYKLSF